MQSDFWVQYIDNEVTYRLPVTDTKIQGEPTHALTPQERVESLRNMGFDAWLAER